MDTIIDYILWRGDLSFTQDPFNELDAIVLSQITYFNMQPYMAHHESGTIAEVYEYLRQFRVLECTLVGKHLRSKKLFEAAAKAPRYRDIRVSRYVDEHNELYSLQFAAVMFTIGGLVDYVSFRGTDASPEGWKEDFMMSFRKTEAQERALEYLRGCVAEGSANRLIVGGHSKGANLAMYASAMLIPTLRMLIDRVYVLDGPGFCPEVFNKDRLARIKSKMTMVKPEYSIFGRLYDPDIPDTKIVKSTEIGIQQHDMSSWRVDHARLMTIKEHAAVSELLVDRVMKWVDGKTLEEREEIVDQVFELLSTDGGKKWGLNLLKK